MRGRWFALAIACAGCAGAPEPAPPAELPTEQATDRGDLAASLLATARECRASDPERAWRSVGTALELQPELAPAALLQARLAWARSYRDAARAAWDAIAETDAAYPWMRVHRAMAATLGGFDGLDAGGDLAWLAANADRDGDATRCGQALTGLGAGDWAAVGMALAGADERWEVTALTALLAEVGPEADRATAAAAYDRLLATEPALGFLCAARARCADAASPGSGRPFWDRAIRSENWRADHRRDRGLSRLAAGDVNGAQTDLEWALRLAPDDAAIRRALARVALARGDTPRALSAITDALARDPNAPGLWAEKARLLGTLRRWKEAQAAWDEALKLDPAQAAALASRARVRAQLGDAAGARADLDNALRLDPRNAEALFARGLMKLDGRDPRGALADFDAALTADPTLTDAYLERAKLHLDRRNAAQAQADLDAFIAAGGVDAWACLMRGRLRLAEGQLAEAAADFDRAVGLDPDNVDARLAQGELAVQRGLLKEALAAFDQVVRDHPSHRVARARRGLMHAALAEWRMARKDLEAALADDDGTGLNDRELAVQCRMALADMRAKRR